MVSATEAGDLAGDGGPVISRKLGKEGELVPHDP
jgi:hypothetical protein